MFQRHGFTDPTAARWRTLTPQARIGVDDTVEVQIPQGIAATKARVLSSDLSRKAPGDLNRDRLLDLTNAANKLQIVDCPPI